MPQRLTMALALVLAISCGGDRKANEPATAPLEVHPSTATVAPKARSSSRCRHRRCRWRGAWRRPAAAASPRRACTRRRIVWRLSRCRHQHDELDRQRPGRRDGRERRGHQRGLAGERVRLRARATSRRPSPARATRSSCGACRPRAGRSPPRRVHLGARDRDVRRHRPGARRSRQACFESRSTSRPSTC